MAAEGGRLLERGGAALQRGAWAEARAAFSAAVQLEPSPDALAGLGAARWWLGEAPEALALWERAYAGHRRSGNDIEAVNLAVSLSLLYQANFGNRAASGGWAGRAERLAAAVGQPVLTAWAMLARAATLLDPSAVERCSRRAHEIGLAAGDADLELCALSMTGTALVDAGRVDEGVRLLDEALAGALGGEIDSLETVVFTSCQLMQACYHSADLDRVVQWCQLLDGFIQRYGCPYVHATCRAAYSAVLLATGDWTRAEVEVAAALDLAAEALPAVRAEAVAVLADLRVAQGRLAEATELVTGYEDHATVVPVVAALQLAGGRPEVAATTARRRLDAAPTRNLEASRLGEVVGLASLATGDVEAAHREGARMVELGRQAGCRLLSARGARLLGRALAAADQAEAATEHLDLARELFATLAMPLEVARTRLALAQVWAVVSPDVAVDHAQSALRTFAALGADTDATAAGACLTRLRSPPDGEPSSAGLSALSRRERQLLELVAQGLSNPEIADRLFISRRTVEHHVAHILTKLGLRNRTEAATYLARRSVDPAEGRQ